MKQVRSGRYTKKITRSHAAKRTGKRYFKWFWRLDRKRKIMVIATPFLIFLIATPVLTYLYYARDISDQERLMNRNNTGVVFLDKSGKTFYSVGQAEQRELVPLDSISDDTENALIASEDKEFYRHPVFNPVSIFRAAFTRYGGGSTISQQLAKNTLLSADRSFLRKYQELFMSIAIEQQYSKAEILEMYLNSVYFGENSFGIKDAAKTYFGKTPAQLNTAESAMLIGLLPAPSSYSPISGNKEYARERQVEVLSRMKREGYIDESKESTALKQKLTYAEQDDQYADAPHYVEMVMKELSDKYGYEKVIRSGYRVTTSLDSKLQKSLEKNIQANMEYIKSNNGSNASAVAIDPSNGQIRALVGSANYKNKKWGKVNMATTPRQPASTFKTLYYAGALADGVITPATVLDDKAINIDGWQPQNADRSFRGKVTVRKAISNSLNIPSIEVMQKYGVARSVKQAKALGVTSLDEKRDYGLPLAIGSGEVPLVEMTNAYATLADKGEMHQTSMIISIKNKFDKQIFTAEQSAPSRAISQAGAFMISDILSDNSARANIFGSSLTVPGHTAAVKTGTTDDSKDALTIGYTPSLAIGVWVGNNDNESMYSGGTAMAGPIWKNTMIEALEAKPDQKFDKPSNVVARSTCYGSYGIATNSEQSGTFEEYYLSSALPTKTCTPEKPKLIKICETSTGKTKEIEEDDFNSKLQSKDLEKCKPKEKKPISIEVCEIATGEIVTIDQTAFDASKYSKDTSSCEPPEEDPDPDETTPVETTGSTPRRLPLPGSF